MTVRRLDPAPIRLLRTPLLTSAAAMNVWSQVPFLVPTPDARVQVNISLVPTIDLTGDMYNGGQPDIWGITTDLSAQIRTFSTWMAAAELEPTGSFVPVTNLVGVNVMPAATFGGGTTGGLLGYSQTVLADCDAVMGAFQMSQSWPGGVVSGLTGKWGGSPSPTTWWLKTRYQAVVPMCDDEWEAIAAQCNPRINGPVVGSWVGP